MCTELLKGIRYKGELVSVLHTENDSLSDAVIPEKVNVLLWKRLYSRKLIRT